MQNYILYSLITHLKEGKQCRHRIKKKERTNTWAPTSCSKAEFTGRRSMSVLIVVWSKGHALRWSLLRHILQTVCPQPKLMGFRIVSSKVCVQIGQERKSVHCGACTGIASGVNWQDKNLKRRFHWNQNLREKKKKVCLLLNIFCKYRQSAHSVKHNLKENKNRKWAFSTGTGIWNLLC